jgi:hypothetical protein
MKMHNKGPRPANDQSHLRDWIGNEIERLIALLDYIEGDENLEPYLADTDPATEDREGAEDDGNGLDTREGDDCDLEPACGWTDGEASNGRYMTPGAMEEEDVNEDGGDIVDEPHDELDEGDSEPTLGWANPMGLRVHVPAEAAELMAGIDGDYGGSLIYDGDGHHIGRKLLRDHVHDKQKLAKALDVTRVSPSYGRYV